MKNLIATIGIIGFAFFCGHEYGRSKNEIKLWVSHNAAGGLNVQRISKDGQPITVLHSRLSPFDYSHAETITLECNEEGK